MSDLLAVTDSTVGWFSGHAAQLTAAGRVHQFAVRAAAQASIATLSEGQSRTLGGDCSAKRPSTAPHSLKRASGSSETEGDSRGFGAIELVVMVAAPLARLAVPQGAVCRTGPVHRKLWRLDAVAGGLAAEIVQHLPEGMAGQFGVSKDSEDTRSRRSLNGRAVAGTIAADPPDHQCTQVAIHSGYVSRRKLARKFRSPACLLLVGPAHSPRCTAAVSPEDRQP